MTKPAERLQLEALALRHVLALPEQDRADACAVLDAHTLDLVGLVGAVARALQTAPGLTVADVAAMLARPELRDEAQRLQDNGADLMDPAAGFDPHTRTAAYHKVLANTQAAGELRRLDEAAELLNHAKAAKTAAERRALLDEAGERIARAERNAEGTLAETWDAHRTDRFTRGDAGPDEVLRIDGTRGQWAAWFNAWLGPRAGLEKGRCMIVGARPGAGKTSLAALLAVDAMAVGCPVLFWQLELSREETLEHLLSQMPGTGRWWNDYWTTRCNRPLPPSWGELLAVPPVNGPEDYHAETIRDAMLNLARKTERDRRAGKTRHACNGLVVVDYTQLLDLLARTGHTPQHEILTKGASMLTKAAADKGLCLVLLSQLTKEAKKDQQVKGQSLEETAFTGADLSRMAHVAFGLSHAAQADNGWTECGARNVAEGPHGEARLLANIKRRGWAKLDGKRPDFTCPLWVSNERAFHGGDATNASWE